jgi:ABC-type nitrate/sulfonate/bicarbonate transport system substrate-binding protein
VRTGFAGVASEIEEKPVLTLGRFAVAAILAWAVSGSSAWALDLVKFGMSGPSVTWTVLDVGNATGIWEKVGIQVQALQFAGDAPTQQALTSGTVDIGLGSGPAMGYRSKGVPATAIATLAGPPYSFVLIVAPNGPIKSVADLKGRSVGVTSAGSMTEWLTRQLSVREGWGPTGITVLPLGADRSRLAAIKTGDLSGSVMAAVTAYSYEEQKQARILLSFGDIVTHFATHVMFASDVLIKNNPDLIRRLLKGWFESVAYMKGHRSEGIAIAAKSLGLSTDAVGRDYDAEMKMLSDDGSFDPEAVSLIQKSLVGLKILSAEPEISQMYNGSFVPVKF